GLHPEARLQLGGGDDRVDRQESPGAPETGQRRGGVTDRARADDGLGHDQSAFNEIGSKRAADSGRDDQRRSRPGRSRVEVRGSRTGAEELESAAAKVRPRAPRDALEAQLAGQTTGLELDGGDAHDAGHAALSGGPAAVTTRTRVTRP